MANRFLTAGLLAAALAASWSEADAADVSARRMTWAHYVPWIVPTHASMDTDRWVNVPVCEKGANPHAEEIRRAQDCGIDGFFMDIVCYEKSMAFWDLRPFLKAAEGTDFQFCICIDKRVAPETCVRQIVQMLGAYGGHPNYPKVGERYVVNAYTYLARPPEEWRMILDGCRKAGFPIFMVANGETFFDPYEDARLEPYAGLFDVLYYFSLTGLAGIPSEQENRRAFEFCQRHGRRFMPCLHPGYFGAWIRGRNDCYQPFRGVDRLFEHFRAAQSFGKDVDWLHVTTWNDHDETTLQPRRLTPADGVLTKAFSRAFKGEAPDVAEPEVVFAYHREELPGTLLRVEALRLPSVRRGDVSVRLRLLGSDGAAVFDAPVRTLAADWNRIDWRVSMVALTGQPHLVPEVTLTFGGTVRRGTLQPIFLRTPWLEHPETVKTGLSFRRDDVRVEWTLAQTGAVLTAGLSFASPVGVRRAILYRNDRPLGQFQSQPTKDPLLTVAFSGQNFMRLTAPGGRLLSVLKSDETNGMPNFSWNGQKADSKLTPTWTRFTALVEVPPTGQVRLDGCNWRKSVCGAPAEIARRKCLADGPVTLRLSPDGTLRERPTLDCREGKFSLSLYAREPAEADVYWIALECADGTVFETPVRQPHANGTFAAPVVETAVTLETASGASGRPDRREWLDGAVDLPKTVVRDVRLARGARRRAHWSFEGSGADSSGDRTVADIPEAMFADGFVGRGLKFDGTRALALPRRLWPAGAWRISVRLKPAAWDGVRRVVFGKRGWHEGVTLALDGAGRPEAILAGGETPANGYSFVARAQKSLRADEWNHVELLCDARSLRVLVDGEEFSRTALVPHRKYGNLTAYLGAAAAEEKTYRGLLDELDVGCLPEAN